jgi:transposase InsO family protein
MASKHAPRRPRLRGYDKALLVWMTKLWPNLLGLCQVVQPSTILRWHRTGFRAYWRWPAYVVRDNDGVYGRAFTRRLRSMGIRDRPIAPRSPWQDPYVERLIGTLLRDCLDHLLIFGEEHLRRILNLYSFYYNETRTHLGLRKDAPLRRAVQRTAIIVAAGAGRALADRRPLRDKLHRA